VWIYPRRALKTIGQISSKLSRRVLRNIIPLISGPRDLRQNSEFSHKEFEYEYSTMENIDDFHFLCHSTGFEIEAS
jgi:hypothetical protein